MRPIENLFGERHEKGALAHDCLLIYLGIYQGEMCTKHGPHQGSWFQKSWHQTEAPRVEDRPVSAQRYEAPL